MITAPNMFRTNRSGTGRRRGAAPMEFVMVLPFLMILTAAIFTMAHASLIRSKAIQDARNDAWHKRYQNGATSSLSLSNSGDAQAIAGLTGRAGADGVVHGTGKAENGGGEEPVNHGLVTHFTMRSQAEHFVFSRPWDHETIAFQRQAPLMLDTRVSVYLLRAGALGSLADVLHLFSHILEATNSGSGASKAQNAINSFANRLDRLNKQITNVENQLRDLRDRLRMATEKAVIRELQRQVDRLESELKQLKKARDQANSVMK